MIASDIDGTWLNLTPVEQAGVTAFITGRTFSEYDAFAKELAQSRPVYMRGVGEVGGNEQAGEFKALVINWLGVTTFYEDNPLHQNIIHNNCPNCTVVMVIR